MGITVRTLRDDLESLTAGLLGKYRLANGATTPAVAVRGDSEGLAPGTHVTGLELVINRLPTLDPVRQYYHESSTETWEVWLLAWDNSNAINQATGLIIADYPGTTAQVITLPESWGPRRQVRLELRDPADIPLVLRDIEGGDFTSGLPAAIADFILDGGNFFDGSTLNTYTKTANGGSFT